MSRSDDEDSDEEKTLSQIYKASSSDSEESEESESEESSNLSDEDEDTDREWKAPSGKLIECTHLKCSARTAQNIALVVEGNALAPKNILNGDSLYIPPYQRPYVWTKNQVLSLNLKHYN